MEESPVSRVGVLAPQAAHGERHDATGDVVPEAKAAEPEAVLALAWRHAFELFDVVRTAPVVRVVRESRKGAAIVLDEVAVTFRELPEFAVKGRGGPDRKGSRGHDARRRFVFFAASALRNSARSAEAGRVRPARTS